MKISFNWCFIFGIASALLLLSGCGANKNIPQAGTIWVEKFADASEKDLLYGDWVLVKRKVRGFWGTLPMEPSDRRRTPNLEDLSSDFLELAAVSNREAPRWQLEPKGGRFMLEIYEIAPATGEKVILQRFKVLKLDKENLVLKQKNRGKRVISHYKRPEIK